jgi:hypothetical protein
MGNVISTSHYISTQRSKKPEIFTEDHIYVSLLRPMKKIAVDIDNILWDFSPIFWERLQKINPEIVPPSIWDKWDFWHKYVTTKQLYGAIKEIHMEQEKFSPYDDARPFLTSSLQATVSKEPSNRPSGGSGCTILPMTKFTSVMTNQCSSMICVQLLMTVLRSLIRPKQPGSFVWAFAVHGTKKPTTHCLTPCRRSLTISIQRATKKFRDAPARRTIWLWQAGNA